jgi:hypothetical protein
MALMQSLRQQHFVEKSAAPTSSRMIEGMSGLSEGVPKMHPLKSSMPVLKAASMMHNLKIKKFKMPSLKLPGLKIH